MSALRRLATITALSMVIVLGFVAFPVTHAAAAFDIFGGSCNDPSGTSSSVCSTARQSNPSNNPLTGQNGLILKVTDILALLAGVIAIIVIIVAGFTLITSGGEPAKAKSARTAIISAVLGIVLILLARTILSFVLSNL